MDFNQFVFFIIAVAVVLFKAWRGWRLGIVRQALNLGALAFAYVAAIFGGRALVPLMRFTGLPDFLLPILGGAVLGLTIYISAGIVAAIVFKKTSEQSVSVVRWGYGASGAALGAVFGLFLVWVTILAIRVLGTIAESEVESARHPVNRVRGVPTPVPLPEPPNAMIRGLARMKHSIESGPAGAVVERIDPVPGQVYSTLGKVGTMISREDAIDRFLGFPGIKELAGHPKLLELSKDPELTKAMLNHDYFKLLRDPRIVAIANDPEFVRALAGVNLDKALDHATTEKKITPAPKSK